MRGENLAACSPAKASEETPPLARGKQCDDLIKIRLVRNTPACAGKTRSKELPNLLQGKHPRLRGENGVGSTRFGNMPETPPLARGKPVNRGGPPAFPRNTPACAGKTSPEQVQTMVDRKHPRLRGENSWSYKTNLPQKETPPLARGKPRARRKKNTGTRNTPACAGKTDIADQAVVLQRKHPRLRGENVAHPAFGGLIEETPPLARGKQNQKATPSQERRNTPACAGKTRFTAYSIRAN